jgi:hypothetical protein
MIIYIDGKLDRDSLTYDEACALPDQPTFTERTLALIAEMEQTRGHVERILAETRALRQRCERHSWWPKVSGERMEMAA